jgi:large repetitive protein
MDDPILTIQFDQTVSEGNSSTKTVSITVSLSKPSAETVTVNYFTENGSTDGGEDFIPVSPSTPDLTFAPGETSKTITLEIKGDTIGETDETFVVILDQPVNAVFTGEQTLSISSEITIQNDDPIINIEIADPVAILEGNSGSSSPLEFIVSLINDNPARTEDITVNYRTVEGSGVDGATAGKDYVAQQGTLTFKPNQTSGKVTIAVLGDNSKENNETFIVDLFSPSPGVIEQGASAMGKITDDDIQVIPPIVSINNVTINEGESGSSIANFTVSLSDKSIEEITVNYTTSNGTGANGAIAPNDYTLVTGTLTFATGETTKGIPVPILNDAFAEFDETFVVTLSNPSNAVFSPGVNTISGIGTILNDDGAIPQLSINDVSIAEGNSGTTTATFTVSLNASAGQPVTVNYATADNTAIAGIDYVSKTGTLTFSPGQTSLPITIDLIGDTAVEPNELFFVNLSGAVNGAIADSQGTGTILNDDSPIPTPPSDQVLMGTSNNDLLTGGEGNDTIKGLAGRDTLFGGNGNDTLVGGTQSDFLTGGIGSDSFVFDIDKRFNRRQIGIDQITDFTRNVDEIVLDRTTFKTLRGLSFASVGTITQAQKSSAQITYVRRTGGLYFNQNRAADGFGSGGQFADLTNGLRLSARDFTVIS